MILLAIKREDGEAGLVASSEIVQRVTECNDVGSRQRCEIVFGVEGDCVGFGALLRAVRQM